MTPDILALMGQHGIPLSPSMQDYHTELGPSSPYQPGPGPQPTLAGPQMTSIAGMAGQASDPLAATQAAPQVPMQGAQQAPTGLSTMQKAVGIGNAIQGAETAAPDPGKITSNGPMQPVMGLLQGMTARSGIPSLFGR